MKKLLLIISLVVLPISLSSKPIMVNCDLFDKGTVLKFQSCLPDSVYAGPAGDGLIWDFSGLTTINDTLTEWMVDPADTPYGNDFPDADLVEKYSDGRYVIAKQNQDESHLLGFVDTQQDFLIKYTQPVLFANRPLTYLKTVTADYSSEFTAAGYSFHGAGTSTLSVDGFGTLILPNGSNDNCLRLKIVQEEYDTLLQFGTVTRNITTSFVWFDGIHNSALLKIDSTHSDTYDTKSVAYLLSEEITDVRYETNKAAFEVYSDPTSNLVNFIVPQTGTLRIFDQSGQCIGTMQVNEGNNSFSSDYLASGIYFAVYQYGSKVSVKKFPSVK